MASDLKVPTVSPSPSEDGILEGHFQPRSKSSYLTAMLRTLSAGSKALMYYGPGSLPHRIIEAVAIELSRTAFDTRRLAVRAVRESAYRAFQDDELFPARFPATYASGAVVISAPIRPLAQDVTLSAGEMISTSEGLTARTLETVTLRAGEQSVIVPVRSEIPGPAGLIEPGRLTVLSSTSALKVINPAPIDGGLDEEADEAIHARFQNYVRGIQTSSARSLLSAAQSVSAGGLRAQQAALIRPWRIPWMNREMGCGYVVIDAGGGSAPEELVEAVQTRVDLVAAAGEEVRVLPCNPYAVQMEIQVICRRDASPEALTQAVKRAYTRAFTNTLIEDGSGRGSVAIADLHAALDAVPGVLSITLSASEGRITTPVGARAVAGVPAVTVTRGL